MRWDDLFADLEARFEDAQTAEWAADAAEQARAERDALSLLDRLRAQRGALRWVLVDGSDLDGAVRETGDGWLLVTTGPTDLLLPLAAVASVTGLSRDAAPDPTPDRGGGVPLRRPSLAGMLRGIARGRATVEVRLVGTPPTDSPLTGTLDAIRADHVDLAVHAPDAPRRAANVVAVQAIRTAAIVSVRLL